MLLLWGMVTLPIFMCFFIVDIRCQNIQLFGNEVKSRSFVRSRNTDNHRVFVAQVCIFIMLKGVTLDMQYVI